MEYSLNQLEENINSFKKGGDAKYYADQIKHLAYVISEGNRLTKKQIDRLRDLINQINSDPSLRWIVYDGLRQKLWQCVYRGREGIASSFYTSHEKDTVQLNGINFNKDVKVVRLKRDEVLYQWCRTIQTNKGMVIYEPNTGKVTVGEYFSKNRVPQEQLGLNPYCDITDPSGKYVTTTNRVCCKFSLPFDVDCLISTAKGTFDNWSVHNMERYGVGGGEQYFIPFKPGKEGKMQKIAFAEKAQFV